MKVRPVFFFLAGDSPSLLEGEFSLRSGNSPTADNNSKQISLFFISFAWKRAMEEEESTIP